MLHVHAYHPQRLGNLLWPGSRTRNIKRLGQAGTLSGNPLAMTASSKIRNSARQACPRQAAHDALVETHGALRHAWALPQVKHGETVLGSLAA